MNERGRNDFPRPRDEVQPPALAYEAASICLRPPFAALPPRLALGPPRHLAGAHLQAVSPGVSPGRVPAGLPSHSYSCSSQLHSQERALQPGPSLPVDLSSHALSCGSDATNVPVPTPGFLTRVLASLAIEPCTSRR